MDTQVNEIERLLSIRPYYPRAPDHVHTANRKLIIQDSPTHKHQCKCSLHYLNFYGPTLSRLANGLQVCSLVSGKASHENQCEGSSVATSPLELCIVEIKI